MPGPVVDGLPEYPHICPPTSSKVQIFAGLLLDICAGQFPPMQHNQQKCRGVWQPSFAASAFDRYSTPGRHPQQGLLLSATMRRKLYHNWAKYEPGRLWSPRTIVHLTRSARKSPLFPAPDSPDSGSIFSVWWLEAIQEQIILSIWSSKYTHTALT